MAKGGDPSDPHAAARYVVTYVPPGCTSVSVGDLVMIYVPTPPPNQTTLNLGGACDGIQCQLPP